MLPLRGTRRSHEGYGGDKGEVEIQGPFCRILSTAKGPLNPAHLVTIMPSNMSKRVATRMEDVLFLLCLIGQCTKNCDSILSRWVEMEAKQEASKLETSHGVFPWLHCGSHVFDRGHGTGMTSLAAATLRASADVGFHSRTHTNPHFLHMGFCASASFLVAKHCLSQLRPQVRRTSAVLTPRS